MKPYFLLSLFVIASVCFFNSCKKHNAQVNSVTELKHWHHIRYVGVDTVICNDTVLVTSYAGSNLEWNGYYFYAQSSSDSVQWYFNQPLCPGAASHVAYNIFYNYYPLTGNANASINNDCLGSNGYDYYWTY